MKRIFIKSVVQNSLLIPVLAVLLAACIQGEKQSQNLEPTQTISTQNQTTPQSTPTTSTQSQTTPQPTPTTSLETKNINGSEPKENLTLIAAREESDLRANLEEVYFKFDSYTLTPRAKEKLLQMAQSMKNNRNLSIQIEGHTDERGTEEYNFNLGKMRAQAVKEFLVAEGVNSQMLSTISYGEENPAIKSSTSKAWKQNRRVELKILP